MYQPNLPNTSNPNKRQEKILAWTLTILLHLAVIGGGIFWYLQHQPTSTLSENTANPTTPIASAPAPTPLQAEIDTSITPPITTTTSSQTPAQSSNTPQPPHQAAPNSTKTQITQQTITTKISPPQAENSPTAPLHTELNKQDFPVNNGTITHTDTKTTPTAYGTITTTTTNRITTIAPEITQALTDDDIPAKERQKLRQETGKLSANAKAAKKLATEVENTHQATNELIETVKKNNQAKIDNDQ